MNVGFNVKKAEELMEEIAKSYNDLGNYASTAWEGVVRTLHNEWVGEDEQDFEEKLAKRICDLYVNAYNLADSSIKTVKNLAEAWNKFQRENVLNESASLEFAAITIPDVAITPIAQIVARVTVPLELTTDRGLRNAGSGGIIQDAITDFVTAIKKKTSELFESISSNKAFFGDQSGSIDTYIQKVGDAIAEVSIAVRDMYNGVAQLTASHYTDAASSISGQTEGALNEINNKVNEATEGTRWTTE